jgi:hypothetical protein
MGGSQLRFQMELAGATIFFLCQLCSLGWLSICFDTTFCQRQTQTARAHRLIWVLTPTLDRWTDLVPRHSSVLPFSIFSSFHNEDGLLSSDRPVQVAHQIVYCSSDVFKISSSKQFHPLFFSKISLIYFLFLLCATVPAKYSSFAPRCILEGVYKATALAATANWRKVQNMRSHHEQARSKTMQNEA